MKTLRFVIYAWKQAGVSSSRDDSVLVVSKQCSSLTHVQRNTGTYQLMNEIFQWLFRVTAVRILTDGMQRKTNMCGYDRGRRSQLLHNITYATALMNDISNKKGKLYHRV